MYPFQEDSLGAPASLPGGGIQEPSAEVIGGRGLTNGGGGGLSSSYKTVVCHVYPWFVPLIIDIIEVRPRHIPNRQHPVPVSKLWRCSSLSNFSRYGVGCNAILIGFDCTPLWQSSYVHEENNPPSEHS